MAEMEIALNLTARAEWDRIQESGHKLQPLYGSGCTGLANLGNTFVPVCCVRVGYLMLFHRFKYRAFAL